MKQEIYMTNKSWLDLCILSGLDPSNKRFNGFDIITKKDMPRDPRGINPLIVAMSQTAL